MIKTDQQKADEIFDFLFRNMERLLKDDEIKYVRWLCQVNDEQAHNTLIGMLKAVKEGR